MEPVKVNKVGFYVKDPFVTGPLCVNKINDPDKVTYDVRDKLIKTGEGEYDFIVEEEVYEKERISRDDYIQSFADDVGLENIIKKMAISGDSSLLRENPNLIGGDFRNIPRNNQERDDIIAAGKAKAKELNIPFSEDGLNAYIKSCVAAEMAAKEAEKAKKEGEN